MAYKDTVDPHSESTRQVWAAEQIPQLITTQQAMFLMKVNNVARFSRLMSANGLTIYRDSQFPTAKFYLKEDVVRLSKIDKRKLIRPEKGLPRLKIYNFESLAPGWTCEDFMHAWGNGDHWKVVIELIERAPSLQRLSGSDARGLLLILLDKSEGLVSSRSRYEKRIFLDEVLKITADQSTQNKLAKIVRNFYNSTYIGIYEPSIVVAVIYELLLTKPPTS